MTILPYIRVAKIKKYSDATCSSMGEPSPQLLAFFNHIFSIKSLKTRKCLFETLNKEQLKLLSEILANVLNGNIEVEEKEKVRLRKHRKVIRSLSNIKLGYKVRRKLILKFPTIITKIFKLLIPLVHKFIEDN